MRTIARVQAGTRVEDPHPRTGSFLVAVLWILAWSAGLALIVHLLEGHVGLNLGDEGYLWYGTQAIGRGEVPIRDFQAYDPGRYLWTGAWSLVLGEGPVALRLSCMFFAAIGCALGMAALHREREDWRTTLLAGVLIMVWMFPPTKVFEQAISLGAIWFGSRLIARPGLSSSALAGVFVGVSGVFGRNHGLYLVIGFGAIWILLICQQRASPRLFLAWLVGVPLGYSPVLALAAFAPGFLRSLVDSVMETAQRGATNYTLPIPWPWRAPDFELGSFQAASHWAMGVCFVLVLFGFLYASITRMRLRSPRSEAHATLLAACALGIPYAHYAFSRADVVHLAHCMPSLLVALLACPPDPTSSIGKLRGIATFGLLLPLSVLATAGGRRVWTRFPGYGGPLVECDIGGELLLLPRWRTDLVHAIREFERDRIGPEEGLLAVPHSPGVYALLKRRSPLWEIYFLWNASDERQRAAIRRLEAGDVPWMVFQEVKIDGREDRQFSATHPILFEYLERRYTLVRTLSDFEHMHVYERSEADSPVR